MFSPVHIPQVVLLLVVTQTIDSVTAHGYSHGVATWYGQPMGIGSAGGACGFQDDVANYPYNGMVAAGNQHVFKSGKGCGVCYEVKCKDHELCSGKSIVVTVTDECPSCDQNTFHLDLSGRAFGSLAKFGHANDLRNAGKIKIEYGRVQCRYNTNIKLKVDKGSNPYYLALLVEHVDGDGDISSIEIKPSQSNGKWMKMQQSWGQTWKTDLPEGTKGPFSVRMVTLKSGKTVTAKDVIPANWHPGQKCDTKTKTYT